MLIDITADELKAIVKRLHESEDPTLQQLLNKLTSYVPPEVDEDKLAEKYQEWKR